MLCDLVTRSASLENPGVSISDPGVWNNLFGGAPSDAGVSVTPKTMMEFSPIWSGIGIISQDVAQVPTFVMRKLPGGGKDRATTHPSYKLLRWRASKSQHLCSSLWKEIMVSRALLHGSSFAEIKRGGAEAATDMPLLPPPPDTKLEKIDGQFWYVTGPTRRLIRPRNVFHLRGPSMEMTGGMSLVEFARHSVGRGMATDKYAASFFKNSALPTGILTHPGRIGETELNNLRQSMQELHGGVSNSHRIGVFEEGVSWTALGIDPLKAQMIQAMAWSVKDAARWLHMPPHKLGDDSRTSFNSVEQEELSYKFSTLGNWFCKIRDEAHEKLLTERQKTAESHTIEEKQTQFLAADTKSRHEVYVMGLNSGIYNIDEVRNIEGFNPLPDDKGKDHIQPLNMSVIGEDEPEQEQEASDDNQDNDSNEDGTSQARAAHVELMRQAFQRSLNRLKHATSKFDGRSAEDVSSHVKPISDILAPCIAASESVGFVIEKTAGAMSARIVSDWQNLVDENRSNGEKRSEKVAERITAETCLRFIGAIK